MIDGWENGIADSPFLGIADMRSANIGSTPGQVAVNFKTAAMNKPPTVSAIAYTTNTTTDVVTVASTSGWYNGMAITLDTVVTSTGISTGRVYWVGDLTATTFKLYVNPSVPAGAVVDITGSNGSGTLSSYTLGKPIAKAVDYSGNNLAADPYSHHQFILDDNGRAWWIDNTGGVPTNNLIYLGNDTLTGSPGRGIAVYKGYIIVFRNTTQDALNGNLVENTTDLDSGSGWTYGWNSISGSNHTPRPVLVGQDDILYYDNSGRVGSISENIGATFDPTSGASYTENTSALDLPDGDDVTALGELGTDLLVGTARNLVYPWDRVSPSFRIPIALSESFTKRIITNGSVAYIFAGSRGRITRTTGDIAEEWKKVPDHLTGYFEPYFGWLDVEISRNQLLFSFEPSQNDGTAITGMGGVWAIDLTTEALRHIHQISPGVSADATLIVRNPFTDDGTTPDYTPAGTGLFIGWDSSSTYGVDTGSSQPYQNYETAITTEIIPLGTYSFKGTPCQIEYKLTRPLVSGEAIKISYRINLAESFTEIWTSNTAGLISDANDSPFENVDWVQLKAELLSISSGASHVPLRELRIRKI